LNSSSRLFNPRSSSVSPSARYSSPHSGSPASSLKSLSAAAQVFVRKAMAKSSASVDANLRASYRGTPSPYGGSLSKGMSRFREGSVVSRSGSVPPLSSPSIREDIVPPGSP
jgi:protein DGCR14